jgi:transmembrane sensor
MTELDEIDIEAHRWAQRLQEGRLSEADRRALSAWQAQSDGHVRAFIRARALSLYMDDLRRRSGVSGTNALSRRQMLAATVSGLALLGGFSWLGMEMFRGQPVERRYETQTGESQRLVLADASELWLNTATEVLVAYGRNRDIQLVHGEVLVTVAKEVRPLVLRARDWVLHALDAVFCAREDVGGVVVSVERGELAVLDPRTDRILRRLEQNQEAVLDSRGGARVRLLSEPELDNRLAWRTRQVVFDQASVQEAIAEMNRYRVRKLRVVGPATAKTVSGTWLVDKPELFLSSLETTFNLRAIEKGGEIVLEPLS